MATHNVLQTIRHYTTRIWIGITLILWTSTTQAELWLWHSRSAQTDQFLHEQLEEFTDENNIEIKILRLPEHTLITDLLTSATDGTLPDALLLPSYYLSFYAELNLAEIPEYRQPESIPNRLFERTALHGKQYGIPIIQGDQMVLYYNKQHVSQPAENWQQLQQQKVQFDPQKLHTITWAYHDVQRLLPFIGRYAPKFLATPQVRFDTPAMRQALSFYRQLAQNQLVDQRCDAHCALQRFSTGKSAYLIDGSWRLPTLQQALQADLGVTYLPSIANNPTSTFYSDLVLVFPNNGLTNRRVKNELIRLMEFLTRSSVQQSWYTELGQLPATEFGLDTVMLDPYPHQQILLQQLMYGEVIPVKTDMRYVLPALEFGFRHYFYHGLSVAEATQYMQKQALRNMYSTITNNR